MTETALKRHIKACPIGWHHGQLKLHRATVDADVIAWIQELERLAGVQQEGAAAKTRLPRPYALEQRDSPGDPREAAKGNLESDGAAARGKPDEGLATDAAVRGVRPGDRFRYVGDVWHVKRVGSGPRGVVTMAREVHDPRDRFEKVVLIDERPFPRHTLREMVKI